MKAFKVLFGILLALFVVGVGVIVVSTAMLNPSFFGDFFAKIAADPLQSLKVLVIALVLLFCAGACFALWLNLIAEDLDYTPTDRKKIKKFSKKEFHECARKFRENG